MCLPEFRFELNSGFKQFNRLGPLAQRTGVNRLAKIICQSLGLKAGRVLIIDRSLFQISPVLLQKSQVNVCFRVVWIRPERMSEICDGLLCLLPVCPDLPQPVQRVRKIALKGKRA